MTRPLHRLRVVVVAAGIVTVGAVVAGCSGNPNKGISIGTARTATVTEVVDAPATVVPRAAATVTSPADGRIAQLYVRDGQQVAAGAVLASIDSPTARQRLAQAEQALAAASSGGVRVPGVDLSGVQAETDAAAGASFAQAAAAVAQIPDPAIRGTAERDLAAGRQHYATAQAQARAAVRAFNAGLAALSSALRSLGVAQRVQAQAAVTLARATVDALTLRAPIGGTVQLGGAPGGVSSGDLSQLLDQLPQGVQGAAGAALAGGAGGTGGSGGSRAGGVGEASPVTEGSVVSTGSAVVTIVDASVLGLQADVDETDVLLVRTGVPARVEFDAVPGARYEAAVTAVNLTPTTSSRGGVSYHVRLTLGPGQLPDGVLAPAPRPGMSAVAHLQVRTARDAVAVPAAAVVRAGDRDAVWVVQRGAAHRRYVTVGTQGDDMVAVAAGLRTGERVVVKGADRVHTGQHLP